MFHLQSRAEVTIRMWDFRVSMQPEFSSRWATSTAPHCPRTSRLHILLLAWLGLKQSELWNPIMLLWLEVELVRFLGIHLQRFKLTSSKRYRGWRIVAGLWFELYELSVWPAMWSWCVLALKSSTILKILTDQSCELWSRLIKREHCQRKFW